MLTFRHDAFGSGSQSDDRACAAIGDRINTAGFEGEVLSGTPLGVRVGQTGLAVVFRYGAVVFLGLTADQEAEIPRTPACALRRQDRPL